MSRPHARVLSPWPWIAITEAGCAAFACEYADSPDIAMTQEPSVQCFDDVIHTAWAIVCLCGISVYVPQATLTAYSSFYPDTELDLLSRPLFLILTNVSRSDACIYLQHCKQLGHTHACTDTSTAACSCHSATPGCTRGARNGYFALLRFWSQVFTSFCLASTFVLAVYVHQLRPLSIPIANTALILSYTAASWVNLCALV